MDQSVVSLVVWFFCILISTQAVINKPCLRSSGGHLILESQNGRNVTLTAPGGYVTVNGVDVADAFHLVHSVRSALTTLSVTPLNFLLSNLTQVVQSLSSETRLAHQLNVLTTNITSAVASVTTVQTSLQSVQNDVLSLQAGFVAINATSLTPDKLQAIQNVSRIYEQLQRNTSLYNARAGIRSIEQRVAVVEARGETIDIISDRLSTVEVAVNQTGRGGGGNVAGMSRRMRTLTRKVSQLTRSLTRIRSRVFRLKCLHEPCLHGGICIGQTSPRGYMCLCAPGWEGPTCTDEVNECLQFIGTDLGCQNGATCTNTMGSYQCSCAPGWHGVHCTTKQDSCTSTSSMEICGHGTCIPTARGAHSYSCICDQGFKASPLGPACTQDVDECALGNHPCSKDPPVQCQNSYGSFRCGSCPAGYEGNGFYCRDIDECATNNGGCSMYPRVECINTRPLRRCGPCPSGYTGNGITCSSMGGACQMSPCHPMATCHDNPAMSSSYYTCTCRPGYTGHGMGHAGCQFVAGNDQSAASPCVPNPCVHGTCTPLGTQYQCRCDSGYTGTNCNEPIDPCASSPCLNGGTCSTSQTSFTCHCPSTHTGARCSIPTGECGGVMSGTSGIVEYPVGTQQYNHNVSCTWVINVHSSSVVKITFTQFHLEGNPPSCSYDYLQIHDGSSSGSPLVGRFCGTTIPGVNNTLTGSADSLYLSFHSDHSYAADGFRFTWTAAIPGCGGSKSGSDHGTINSPGYPSYYPPNTDCLWAVEVRPGKKIQFSFATLRIETHANCSYDYLEIRDGLTLSSPVLGRYCSTQDVPAPITTSSSEALVHFHTDQDTHDTGFHITYTSQPGVAGCGGMLTRNEGEFSVPTVAGRYERNTVCEWLIRVHPNEKIELNFTDFRLEHHTSCGFDVVEIRDGPQTTSPLLGRYCSDDQPDTLRSTGNQLLVYFRSDSSGQYEGFQARYRVACGGEYRGDNGVITSPYHPDSYPHLRSCNYVIRQEIGKAVVLNFTSFDIEGPNGTCPFDYVEIRDGARETSSLIGRYCGAGQHSPPLIISSLNALFIKFKTDGDVANNGFSATYSTIDIRCGGIHHDLVGTLTSPNSPGRYMGSQDCTWVIDVPAGYVIQLTWHSFALRGGRICSHDYVEVFDNSTIRGTGGLVGGRRYCGTTTPPSMTSLGNIMTIRFHSDSDLNRDGFALAYHALHSETACGGSYHTSTGRIQSPMFPNGYPSRRNCDWTITVRPHHQIRLNFTVVDLEGNSNRCHDYLELRNGMYNTSPLIQKICGQNVTVDEIFSHTNQLHLKFVSDYSVNFRGFELFWDETATGCGGTLTSPTGEIISPGYPQPFYRRASCYWTIRVNKGSKVHLNFLDLDLGYCFANYVEVRDGPYPTSPLIGRYCSEQSFVSINGSTNTLWVKLQGSLQSSQRGFRATYYSNCNVDVVAPYGVIESPNFPHNYPHQRNCTWTIKAPRGNSINATFSHFDVEDQRSTDSNLCPYDFLEIKVGNRESHDRTIKGHYCGVHSPPQLYSGNRMDIMQIKFKSDFSVAHNGFRMEYVISGCSKVLRDPRGRFTSPNYPNSYPVNTDCEWNLEVVPGQRIEIVLEEYDIESSFSGTECDYDSLSIYGGPDKSSPRLQHLCHHRSSPLTVTTQGHRALVVISSDGSVRGRGFSASYKALQGGCGGSFKSERGEIHSPNYPSEYDPQSDCIWSINVDKNHVVELNFTDFAVENHHNCSFDNITLYDGDSIESPILLEYCGLSLPNPSVIRSSANHMTLRLKTDSSVGGAGFKATYKSGCGATLNASVDQTLSAISSPGFPNLFNQGTNCTWHLQAPEGYKVQLRFTTLNIERIRFATTTTNQTCAQDYVGVYNGLDMQSPELGRYCGSHLPLPVVSSDRYMTVHMNSLRGDGAGFRALYSAVDTACGGDLVSMSGQLASPNYPDSYLPSYDCVWTIRAGEGNKIELNFQMFDMESSENCNLDYVEVHAVNAEGPLLLHNCSTTIPAPLTATGGLWIRFRSSEEGTANGFLASYRVVPGNEIYADTGVVASPLFPHLFIGRGDFDYKISVADGSFVSVRITNMAVEVDSVSDVCLSSVVIYDGTSDGNAILGTYCGYIPSSVPIVSSTNTVLVRFHSAFMHEGSKFRLTYRAVSERVTSDVISQTAGFDSNCTFMVTLNNTDVIRSPGYPGNYSNNLRCEWIIETEFGSRVYLWTGHRLYMEESENCIYDRIEVYDGLHGQMNWNKTHTLCRRTDRYKAIISTGRFLRIVLITDSYVQNQGFRFRIHKKCGGLLTGSEGVIRAGSEWATSICEWQIDVRPGRTIQFTFEKFNIMNTTTGCEHRYLLMYNGLTSSSPFLGTGRYCGSSIPIIPETSANAALVKYRSRFQSNSDQGIRLKYREIGSDCGGTYHLTSSSPDLVLSSPNYPNPAHPHTECTWIITTTQGKAITLNFLESFDITRFGRASCEKAFVEVREGGTVLSNLLGKFCGTTIPNTLAALEGTFYIRYYTDADTVHSGFKAKASIGVCGGTYNLRAGYLPSPNYPANYEPNLNCSWNIFAPRGHYLTFEFPEIKIFSRTRNCSDSGLVIRDNRMDNVSTTICGMDIHPEPFDTASNNATVKFISGSPEPGGEGKFKVFINSSTEECGGTFTGMAGTIYSPGYPHGISHNWNCEYIIRGPVGSRITAVVEDLDLSMTAPFCFVIMSFYNGLGNYRGRIRYINCYSQNVSRPIQSSMNLMTMRLISHENGGRGFKIKWSADEPQECGGILTATSGIIESPGLANGGYNHSLYCEWQIENPNPSNSSINVTVTYKHLERHCYDQIVIESALPSGEPMARTRICQGTTQKTFILPYPHIKIKFITDHSVNETGFNMTYSYVNCGGYLTGPQDQIQSPNYPNNYPPNTECNWIFDYPPGSQVELNFTHFALEDSLNHDFVKVYNGPRFTSPTIAHFSGTTHENIISQSHQMILQFQSDATNTASGFTAYSSVHTRGCGGTYHSMRGTITSPGYSRGIDYLANVECRWNIRTRPGYYLRVQFRDQFDLETSTNCNNDFVQISHPSNKTGVVTVDTEAKLCGKQMPADVNSTSFRMDILFRTNNAVQGRGFKMQWFGVCGGYYPDPEGVIVSPNHPQPYPTRTRCEYHIVASPESFVTLNFTSLDIQSWGRPCHDKLIVKEHHRGLYWTNQTICGYHMAEPLVKRGEVILIFQSNYWNRRHIGFAISYKVESCGGTITEPGDIMLPGNPNSYSNHMDCNWDITAPSGKVVVIKFQKLILEMHDKCNYDSVSVYKGHESVPNNLLRKLCGDHSDALPIMSTNTSSVRVSFVSDSFYTRQGFKATIQFTQACGGALIIPNGDSSQTIRSPDSNHDGNYEPYLACTWHIVGNENMLLALNFSRLQIEGPTQNDTLPCPYDYVQIFDGPSELSPMLTTLCGTTLPSKALSASRNSLTIRFISDSSHEMAGFTALVTNVPRLCGGKLTATSESQSIESPGYSRAYPPDVRCFWSIQAGTTSQSIHLDINDFNIEASPKCIKDSLHVAEYSDEQSVIHSGTSIVQRDALNINGRMAYMSDMTVDHTYCGTHIPHRLNSVTNQLGLLFISDSSGSGTGFRIHYSIATCNRTYTFMSATLKSTPTDNECYVTISVPQGKYIALHFSYFRSRMDTEKTFKVYDGSSTTATVLADYSAVTRRPDSVFSSGSSMFLKIIGTSNHLRYRMNYVVSDSPNGCGGMMFGKMMIFTSPSYPQTPAANQSCVYTIRVPEPFHVAVRFSTWDFTSAGNCSTTFLQIADVLPSGSLGTPSTYCEQTNPGTHLAVGSSMVIRFDIGESGVNGTGWIAAFAAFTVPEQIDFEQNPDE